MLQITVCHYLKTFQELMTMRNQAPSVAFLNSKFLCTVIIFAPESVVYVEAWHVGGNFSRVRVEKLQHLFGLKGDARF